MTRESLSPAAGGPAGLSAREPELERAHAPSRRDFLERWFRQGRPVLMTGLMDSWPALRRWSFGFLRGLGRGRPVRIEWGNVLQGEPRFEARDLAEFLDPLLSPEAYGPGPKPYLAQFDIFKCLPELKGDVRFDLWKGRIQVPLGWIGPAGTYTGLHWDVAPNLFGQILGSKEFTLYPPGQGRHLYPARRYDFGSVLSEVDGRHPDLLRHPGFAEARGIRAVVRPGEMLFTPRGWWHQVTSLEHSISVSSFAFGPLELARDALPGLAKHALHLAGLYRRGECTCHRNPR